MNVIVVRGEGGGSEASGQPGMELYSWIHAGKVRAIQYLLIVSFNFINLLRKQSGWASNVPTSINNTVNKLFFQYLPFNS